MTSEPVPPLAPEQARRIDEQLALLERARPLLPLGAAPYFAHVRVAARSGRPRDVLLGRGAHAAEGLTVIDWQNAPLAEVFFACAEGEEYAVDLGDRTVEGTLLERNALAFDAEGALVEIATPEALLTRRDGGPWRAAPLPPRTLVARPPGAPPRTSPVEVELDAEQARIVVLPPGRPLLVLGEAGHGKTTVALHRLARLCKAAPGAFRAAVVVPADGLRRLVETSLERLGVTDVEVALYDRWAARQARRAFPGLPGRESRNATAGVIQLKRHPALRVALAALAGTGAGGAVHARRGLLEHLFGDEELLALVAGAAPSAAPPHALRETLEHTHVQFSPTSEQQYRHVDAERLATLDERSLDDGTPTEDAGTIDVEDYAVLFELDRLLAERRRARPRAPGPYDCIVVDEAQELAPLELALLGRAIAPGGTLVVAGDADQQVDPGAAFTGWPDAMVELGARDHDRAVLAMSYRCPPGVTATARAILRQAPPPPPDPAVAFARFEDELHRAAWLVEEIRALRERDPSSSIAVICRTPEGARRLVQVLRLGVGARLALDGDFALRPGVDVTCVREVKGLEFDHVIVPDATPAQYPDAPDARRALYVAVTRAMTQLVLATVGAFSPIIQIQ